MNPELVALALGTVLAVGALAFVLYPLFFDTSAAEPVRVSAASDEESAIRALREIEFDRATGKLSDTDYRALRATYAERALRELRAGEESTAAGPAPAAVDIEERIRAYRLAHRECTRCGLRPEPDAIYCSTCGDFLGGACPSCGASIAETAAAFCSTCGAGLAATQPA